jgi:hypothetical protein
MATAKSPLKSCGVTSFMATTSPFWRAFVALARSAVVGFLGTVTT